MIFSMFKKQREINAIINDLRRQGNLDEAKLKGIRKRIILVCFFLSAPLILAALFIGIPFYAWGACEQDLILSCYKSKSINLLLFLFILGFAFLFFYFRTIKSFLERESLLILLMTNGSVAKGVFLDGGNCSYALNPGYGYKLYYKFFDNNKKCVHGTFFLPSSFTQHDFKKGDEIIVAYDPENPKKNVCILDGALDHYNLKLDRAL